MTASFQRIGIVSMTSALLLVAGAVWAEEQGKQCQLPGDGVDGPALSYRTHSDGTITDLNTRLTWEMKDEGSGIHGVNQTFTWSTGGNACNGTTPDGTAFTVFLDTLNNKCEGDETTACTKNSDCKGIGNGNCGFAGHRDWRMPNVKELQSIVDYGLFQPAIDPSLGPTRGLGGVNYWSFTTSAVNSANPEVFALFVNFDTGFVSADCKSYANPVRAVRDGQ
jgi:hypothetical protein